MVAAQPRLLWLGLAVLVFITGYQGWAHALPRRHSTDDIAANKVLVRRWIEEGFNGRALKVVDEIFGESFNVNGRPARREQLRQNMQGRLSAFPDLQVTIDELVGERNKVAVWYTARGTHKGVFEGIAPTGRHVTWSGCDVLLIEKGRIVQARFVDDSLGLLRQLGARLELPASTR